MTNDPYDAFSPPDASTLVSFRPDGDTVYATITADAISSVEVDVIREALREAMLEPREDGPGLRHLVVDLERVSFINSQAIGMLVTTYSTALHRDVDLVLANVTDPVYEIFVVTKMTRMLKACRTPKELERALAGE